jgi:hypothetical protein
MFEPTMPRWVKGVEYRSLTVLLADFRTQLERESGGTIEQLDMNTAEMLSDLCNFLGLSDKNRRIVLGNDGARHVDMIEQTPVMGTIRH